MSGGSIQFEKHEIGFNKDTFANLIGQLMSNNPNFFTLERMNNIVGMEGIRIEDGKIMI